MSKKFELEPIEEEKIIELKEAATDNIIENMLISGESIRNIQKTTGLPANIIRCKISEVLERWQEEVALMGDFGRKESLNRKINKLINELINITEFIKDQMTKTKSVRWAEALSRAFSTIARFIDIQAKIVGAYQDNTIILNKIEIWKKTISENPNYIEIEPEDENS